MSADIAPDASNTVAIKKFFYADTPASEFMAELKQLTDKDKDELGEGIRTGTLTY